MALFPLKKLPYGECGYRKIRSGNFLYVDKTRYIETLENGDSNHLLLIRPRGFGKTLFTETLSAYYDVNQADNFDENFNDTYIGTHKTPLASQFFLLKFDFSGLSHGNVVGNFYVSVRSSLIDFFNRYPHAERNNILSGRSSSAAALLNRFFSSLGYDYRQRLFVIIDGYDLLSDALLSSGRTDYPPNLSDDDFIQNFYEQIKLAAGDSGPVAKTFVTGVTYASVDRSFINHLSDAPKFAGLYGFTAEELLNAVPQILDLSQLGMTAKTVVSDLLSWYGSYHCSAYDDTAVLNPVDCFHYLMSLESTNQPPIELLDSAQQKIERLTALLNLGRPDFVKSIISHVHQHRTIPFTRGSLSMLTHSSRQCFDEDSVLSALISLGFLTYVPGDLFSLTVPNRAVAALFAEYERKP